MVIEALATGTPVIAYNLSPINEIIENGIHGRLLSKDNVARLANTLVKFNFYNYNEMILKVKAREYDLENLEKFHEVYNNLIT